MSHQQTRAKIGLIGATALVLGNLVGSGAFVLPANMAKKGYIGLVSWGFTAAGAMLLALMFARLSMKVPKPGGPHVFVEAAYGNKTLSYYTAWGYWMLTWIGNAAIVVAMYAYFNDMVGEELSSYQLFSFGIATLAFMTYINVRGIQEANFVQILITVLKGIPMVAVPLIAFKNFRPEISLQFNLTGSSNLLAFQGAAVLTLWSFVGIESATVPADDVDQPTKTIPRATLLGTFLAGLVYIGGNFLLMGAVPLDVLAASDAPYATAATFLMGPSLGKLVSIAAFICCIGTLNGWMLLVGQIPKGAADDGLFPKYFGVLSNRGVPARGIILSAVLMGLILLITLRPDLSDQFDFIAELAVTSLLLIFVIILGCYYELYVKVMGRLSDYVIFILGGLYTVWSLYAAGVNMLLYSTVIIFSGYPAQILLEKWGNRNNKDE